MNIIIEHASVLVPKRGTAEQRRQIDVELRPKNPQLADTLANMFPNYSDDYAIIDLEWGGEGMMDKMWECQIPWPIAKLPLLKDRAVGTPKVHNIIGVETEEDWIDYSFTLKASAAFGLLQTAGTIPQDAVLQTFGEDVPYDADGEQEEIEPDEDEDEGRND
jgi:hypothetical protein